MSGEENHEETDGQRKSRMVWVCIIKRCLIQKPVSEWRLRRKRAAQFPSEMLPRVAVLFPVSLAPLGLSQLSNHRYNSNKSATLVDVNVIKHWWCAQDSILCQTTKTSTYHQQHHVMSETVHCDWSNIEADLPQYPLLHDWFWLFSKNMSAKPAYELHHTQSCELPAMIVLAKQFYWDLNSNIGRKSTHNRNKISCKLKVSSRKAADLLEKNIFGLLWT